MAWTPQADVPIKWRCSSRDSGVGDFGHKGIQTFINNHNCTDLCHSLSLDTHYPLIIPMDGEEDANSDGEQRGSSDNDSDRGGESLQVHDQSSCFENFASCIYRLIIIEDYNNELQGNGKFIPLSNILGHGSI
jgi:hypothetical protein